MVLWCNIFLTVHLPLWTFLQNPLCLPLLFYPTSIHWVLQSQVLGILSFPHCIIIPHIVSFIQWFWTSSYTAITIYVYISTLFLFYGPQTQICNGLSKAVTWKPHMYPKFNVSNMEFSIFSCQLYSPCFSFVNKWYFYWSKCLNQNSRSLSHQLLSLTTVLSLSLSPIYPTSQCWMYPPLSVCTSITLFFLDYWNSLWTS